MAIGGRLYKDVLRLWASGVSVVTNGTTETVQAITVSSFTSLSLDPPLVLICIETTSRSHDSIVREGRFAINVLSAGQEAISDMAAGRRGPSGHTLPGVARRIETTGAPVIDATLAWLDCVLVARHDGGDHSIFVGRVEAAGASDGTPLLWFDRGYRRLGGGD